MFDPNEESIVLEIVRGFFEVPGEDMMKIGDLTKKLLFDPGVDNEEAAAENIKAALKDLSKEHVLIAGVFLSGLLRCNLGPQIQQMYMQEMEEGCGCQEPEGCSEAECGQCDQCDQEIEEDSHKSG